MEGGFSILAAMKRQLEQRNNMADASTAEGMVRPI
jgi:hypothetical protein